MPNVFIFVSTWPCPYDMNYCRLKLIYFHQEQEILFFPETEVIKRNKTIGSIYYQNYYLANVVFSVAISPIRRHLKKNLEIFKNVCFWSFWVASSRKLLFLMSYKILDLDFLATSLRKIYGITDFLPLIIFILMPY